MKRFLVGGALAAAFLSPLAFAQSQAPATTPRIGMVNVNVADLDRSAHFYESVFGLSPPRAYNARERVFTLDQAGARLELELSDTPPSNSGFSMLVADVDAVVSRTAAAGGAVVRPAGAPANNYRTALIRDPDGALIEVLQPVARP